MVSIPSLWIIRGTICTNIAIFAGSACELNMAGKKTSGHRATDFSTACFAAASEAKMPTHLNPFPVSLG